MNLKFKLPLIILLLALIGLSAWGYPVIKSRYFNKQQTQQTSQNEPVDNSTDENGTAADNSSDTSTPTADPSIDDTQETPDDAAIASGDTFLDVTAADCKGGCADFADPDDTAYCKQFCGLAGVKKDPGDCDQLEDLERDYCLKDQAINKKDAATCDKIEDGGIKKLCKNRLIEDIIDAQKQ